MRNGATTLFAGLDVKTGLVFGARHPRHRAKEFMRILKRIDRCAQKHLEAQDARRKALAPQASPFPSTLYADQQARNTGQPKRKPP